MSPISINNRMPLDILKRMGFRSTKGINTCEELYINAEEDKFIVFCALMVRFDRIKRKTQARVPD